MARYLYSITVTVVRGAKNRFGDFEISSEHAVDDVVKFPRSETSFSTENDDRASGVVTGHVLLPPPGADIRATDRLRLPGEPEGSALWEVDGDVGDYQSPFTGWNPGGVVAISKAVG